MDISKAITEPFANYHNFHENLNSRVKILAASLFHTLSFLKAPGNKGEIERLIKSADSSWKYSPVLSLDGYSDNEIFNYVSELSIFSSFSAFDDCLTGISGEVSRWASFKEVTLQTNRSSEDASEGKIEKFYDKFSWRVDEIAKYIPIFNYFQAIRNCIAHRNSKASIELQSISTSDILIDAVRENFPSGEPLPEFKEGDLIILKPKTTLLCSHILRLVCQNMNKHLVTYLGDEGLLYMACHHVFFKDRTERTEAKNTAEVVLNSILAKRYKITCEDKHKLVALAKELGIWKRCLESYDHKYATANHKNRTTSSLKKKKLKRPQAR